MSKPETPQLCHGCGRRFNYDFYINNDLWMRAIGKKEGLYCAHCILEKLGGLEWYIVWNEQAETMHNFTDESNKGE